MTRRRRAAPPDDSLDLLLDTITNTFGGVLFLAILVTVLLKSSDPPRLPADATSKPHTELENRSAALATLQDTIETLRKTAKEQILALGEIRATAEANAAAELSELRAAVTAMERENEELREQLSSARSAKLEMAREQLKEQQALDAASSEIALGKSEYQEELAKRRMSTALPEAHETRRTEYVIAVRYDELYCIYKPLARLRGELNVDDFDALSQGGDTMTILPKQGRGLRISDPGLAKMLQARLPGVSPQSYYICVLIWPDSFDAFASLRQAMVSLGYEYRAIIMDEEGLVGTDAGGGAYVQ
jgi:hypothetical protein